MLKGASNRSSLGTLVKRKTRFVTLAKMEGNGAAAALEGFTRQMKRLPAFLRRSLTYDRGMETACHPELARRLKIDIWLGRSPSIGGKTVPPDCFRFRLILGSAARTRTPTAFCASSCPRGPIFASSASETSTTSPNS